MRTTACAVVIAWMRVTQALIVKTALLGLLLSGTLDLWGDQVVTIYFCGTGLKSDAHTASHWGDPELIASLYHDDASVEIEPGPWLPDYGVWFPPTHSTNCSNPHQHHKYIVNGIGTRPDSTTDEVFLLLADAIGRGDPDLGRRTWNNVDVEAQYALWAVVTNHPLETNYVVNLVGFSRGGVSALTLARSVTDWWFVRKINILACDPVPGIFDPVGRLGANLHLSSKVNQYVGLYARDERTWMFEPVIPAREAPSVTKQLRVTMPGAHETQVGNRQADGHGTTFLQTPNNTSLTNLRYVSDVARVIAEQLLTSPEWGNVPLSLDTNLCVGGVDSFEEFATLVTNMWNQDYGSVRQFAFYPAWGVVDPFFATLGRDYMLRTFVVPRFVLPYRLCFVAPHRHPPEFIWWHFPFFFPSPEAVYWLDTRATPIATNTWDTLQSFRETPLQDTVPPVPAVDPLDPIVGECSVSLTAPPTARDDVSGTVVGTTTDPLTYTQPGTNTITWTYQDGSSNAATQTQTIIVQDTTPPLIEQLTATPNVLWPPNHKVVPVTIAVATADNCGSNVVSRISSVTSNESVNGLGDGNRAPDWEITGDLTLNLRAERSGKGNGRVYTISVVCADDQGNTSTGTVNVTVH